MKRNYGIDTLRIISMLMIVILHILLNGGVISNTQNLTINYEVVWLLEFICIGAVDCFALISGYVMCESEVKYHKIFELLIQVLFYSVGITVLFFIMDRALISDGGYKLLLKGLLPIELDRYWYFTAYFGLFFFTPFLNKLISILTKQEYKKLLITGIVLFCMLPIGWITDPFKLNAGYSMLWLMFLYMMGGYFKKYNISSLYTKKIWFRLYIIAVLVTWSMGIVIDFIPKLSSYRMLLINYNFPTVLLSAIGLFLFCVNLNIKNECVIKVIKLFAPVSFGVYLIHVQPIIFDEVLAGLFSSYAHYSLVIMVISILGSALGIYVICSLIDMIRMKIFQVLKINNFIKNLLKTREKL